MLRALRSGLISFLLSGSLLSIPVHAHAELSVLALQWRDLTVELPRQDWARVSPDTDATLAPHRLLLERNEPMHYGQIIVYPREAPTALAPAEVATEYFDSQKNSTSASGAYSDWKSSSRIIGGSERPVLSGRFTPSAGPPVTDLLSVLVFPADYAERQRYLEVQWVDRHSATTGPETLDELDRFVANLSLNPLGSVLLTDDFSDQLSGPLSDNGPSEHFDVNYKDGEFTIQKSAPDFDGVYSAFIPGTYVDTALAVDAHVTDSGYGPLEFLWCRRSADGSYRVAVDPSDGSAHLVRVTASGDSTEIVPWIKSAAIKTGTASNHLEFICRGSLIELDANGARVLSAHDSDLLEGSLSIGAGGFTDYDVTPEIRFANLIITQR